MAQDDGWVTVGSAAAIAPGEVRAASAGDKQLALYNLDGAFYATDNICTHAYAELSDGWLDGDVIECPLHAGRFEIKTGKALGPPLEEDIKTYPVRLEGDAIQVKLG
jgi:naphthalene 1,2-dioxygenase system ferredoxin subunit